MFLSIHSGSAGLFTPHAYSMEERITSKVMYSLKLSRINESLECYTRRSLSYV